MFQTNCKLCHVQQWLIGFDSNCDLGASFSSEAAAFVSYLRTGGMQEETLFNHITHQHLVTILPNHLPNHQWTMIILRHKPWVFRWLYSGHAEKTQNGLKKDLDNWAWDTAGCLILLPSHRAFLPVNLYKYPPHRHYSQITLYLKHCWNMTTLDRHK